MDVKRVSEMQNWAIRYMKAGMSVIPVSQDKKPLIKWEQYQKRLATEKEILEWWLQYPNANIAVVTGAISNKAVIDIDDPNIKNGLLESIEAFANPPITITPRGGKHQWFAYPKKEVRNTTSLFPSVDFRGEGGYVIVPPSTNGNGKAYSWEKSIFDIDIPTLPDSIVYLLNSSIRFQTPEKQPEPLKNQPLAECQQNVSTLTNADASLQMLTQGRRDEDLFHIAWCMVKGGAKEHEVMEVVSRLAPTCNPPVSLKDAHEKIKSAFNRGVRKEGTIAEEIRQWCEMQDGFFLISDLCSSLGLTTRQDKNAAYQTVGRLMKDNVIEKFGNKSGCYRRIDKDLTEMDWEKAPTTDLDMTYPFGIEKLVKTYPSNIIIIAGVANSGKTSFLLDLARLNINKFPIHYFNSEMGLSELKMRLELFENCNAKLWKKIKFFERGDNFDDVIQPNGINIIDYLEVLDDFWKVGQQIKAIHNKLKEGVAFIAIQKNKGAELGRGGALGLEKPRLYINMDYGKLKIIKAKNWRDSGNPNGQCVNFKIVKGWNLLPQGGWYYEQ